MTILAMLWQMVAISRAFEPSIFPTIDVIIKALWNSITNGKIIGESVYSLLLISKGLLIGLGSAVLIASLCMFSKIFHEFVDTVAAMAHPLPGVALLPLIILWMGTGANAIIFIIVHSVIWPMLLNILIGFREIPAIYNEVGQNFELSRVKSILYIMVPASFPYILVGTKIGWARAWRALISAEMIFGAAGGKGGLGWYIFQKRVFMDTVGIYAGLIIIIFIGIFVEDFIFEKIEKLTVKRWGTYV
ncbi:MAG: ABC transporter permease [Bacillota bacterium]